MASRDELAGTEVYMHKVVGLRVLLLLSARGGGIGGSANIDVELGDIEGPILGGDLGISLDAVLVGLVDDIGMIFTGLYGAFFGIS